MKEKELLNELAKADKNALQEVYLKNRDAFLEFGKKFFVNADDILDVYQDAIIVLQEQAVKGKLKDLRCSIRTYLFGVGKYMIYSKLRERKMKVDTIQLKNELYDYQQIADEFYAENLSSYQEQLKNAFEMLGKKCKAILSLFYYRGFSIDEISDLLGYRNKNVVKSQKSRCLKQLKEIANKNE